MGRIEHRVHAHRPAFRGAAHALELALATLANLLGPARHFAATAMSRIDGRIDAAIAADGGAVAAGDLADARVARFASRAHATARAAVARVDIHVDALVITFRRSADAFEPAFTFAAYLAGAAWMPTTSAILPAQREIHTSVATAFGAPETAHTTLPLRADFTVATRAAARPAVLRIQRGVDTLAIAHGKIAGAVRRACRCSYDPGFARSTALDQRKTRHGKCPQEKKEPLCLVRINHHRALRSSSNRISEVTTSCRVRCQRRPAERAAWLKARTQRRTAIAQFGAGCTVKANTCSPSTSSGSKPTRRSPQVTGSRVRSSSA